MTARGAEVAATASNLAVEKLREDGPTSAGSRLVEPAQDDASFAVERDRISVSLFQCCLASTVASTDLSQQPLDYLVIS